jgi:alpha-mannosidase
MDQGKRSFSNSISLHAGAWNDAHVAGEADVFLTRPIPYLTNHYAGKLPTSSTLAAINLANIAMPAWKLSENGQGWIIRCLELEGRASAALLQLPAWQQKVPLEFRPAEIKTLFAPLTGGPVRETNLPED